MRELLEESLEYLSKYGTNFDLEKRIIAELAKPEPEPEPAQKELYAALKRLLDSDKNIAQAPDYDLKQAATNESLAAPLREQAAAVLQARAALEKARAAP